uniref:Uncharacterized protein n=1 Tax=Anguilla anguilla TaxID=7936 RepID=A0A0E9UT25_ANGAN
MHNCTSMCIYFAALFLGVRAVWMTYTLWPFLMLFHLRSVSGFGMHYSARLNDHAEILKYNFSSFL